MLSAVLYNLKSQVVCLTLGSEHIAQFQRRPTEKKERKKAGTTSSYGIARARDERASPLKSCAVLPAFICDEDPDQSRVASSRAGITLIMND